MNKLYLSVLALAFTITSARAQVFAYEPKTESITFTAPDSMSVEQSFKFVKKLIPAGLCAHTRYVIKDGKRYMRKYYVHNILSRKTYLIEDRAREAGTAGPR